ncbi:MAG: NfeD family protein [Lachnospiraceae bacterium]|nr:NfeD family protein [Lachnospiraceae bacterium]
MGAVLCWLLMAAIFIVIELVTLGLTTIWFAGGAFVAAVAAALGADLVIQVILFLVVSIVLLVLTRPIAVKHLDANIEKTNSEALIGQTAVVIQEINNLDGVGQAKVNGMEWTARAKKEDEIIPVGTNVTIVEISGVKLIVETEKDVTTEVASDKKEA